MKRYYLPFEETMTEQILLQVKIMILQLTLFGLEIELDNLMVDMLNFVEVLKIQLELNVDQL